MSHRPQIVSRGPVTALLFLALLAVLPAPAHAADNILSLAGGPVCVVPTSLDFGYVLEGESRDRWLVIENLGTETLFLEPHLNGVDFFLVDCPTEIPPGGSGIATIRFAPVYHTGQGFGYTGTFFPTYTQNWDCESVFLTGTRRTFGYECDIQATNLDFGDVLIGESASQTLTVTNTGSRDLSLLPSSVSSAFTIAGGLRTLPPGITTTFLVTYTPQDVGHVISEAFLGDVCENVYFEGTGIRNVGSDQDLVGLYFDTNFSLTQAVTESAYTPLTCYLVMHNPSDPAGVGAWELALKLKGDGQVMGYTLEGDHVNAGTGNEFYVGLGNQPLLPDPDGDILLATFDLLVTNPYPYELLVQLIPTPTPSLPGLMSWIPWDDPENILPLMPTTGEWTVGWVNAPNISGAEMPVPASRLLPNVPNPFNPSTRVRFELGEMGPARVTVFDLAGRRIRTLVDETLPAGPHVRVWDGRDDSGRQVSSGAYYVKLVAGSRVDHQKVMLLK